jgi:hypothetical protein
MHGQGTFYDPRLNDPVQFPIAAREGFGNVRNTPDLITAKLAALHFYQLAIPAPAPPAGSFDQAAADRGKMVFEGAGKCSSCHNGAQLTDANSKLHDPSEVVSEPEPNGAPSYASRSATKMYRTAPLHGVWQHAPYFHNGSAKTLDAVVEAYDSKKSLGLTTEQKADLVQYLKSL